jgi:hypothetical protein
MNDDIAAQLGATSQAITAADEAHLQHVHNDEIWERRGILQRLTRVDGQSARQERTARGLTPVHADAAPGN